MKIALIHDWLTGYRGGERVLEHLAQRFPEADIFTLVHSPGKTSPAIDSHPITASPLGRIPGIERHYRKFLPLFPAAIRGFDLDGYDFVLSTSHAVAKSVRRPTNAAHLSYCFTPMRYIWDQADAYLGRGPRRWAARPLVSALRRFDRATSGPDSVTRFVAISQEVSGRIERAYGRRASVIAPPVDLSWIEAPTESVRPRDFYLMVGGFVPYKREQLAIDAFRGSSRRLVIAGDGPTRVQLEAGAPKNVEFLGHVDSNELARLYRNARALLYPQLEDFGLIAVEAQGAGCPVIAFGAGGALDTVRAFPMEAEDRRFSPDKGNAATGLFFDRAEVGVLAQAIERFEKLEDRFDPQAIRSWAESFSPERFDREFDLEIAAARGAVR